jgi:hypothetical protein
MNWEKIGAESKHFRMEPSPEAWYSVEERIRNEQGKVWNFRSVLKVAAAILLLVVAGIWYLGQPKPQGVPPSYTLESLPLDEVDEVAVMALNFRNFLEINHPDIMENSKR